MCAKDYATYSLSMYVTNNRDAPIFDELSTGLLLVPFFLSRPVITAKTDARWQAYETQNKAIVLSFLRKVQL